MRWRDGNDHIEPGGERSDSEPGPPGGRAYAEPPKGDFLALGGPTKAAEDGPSASGSLVALVPRDALTQPPATARPSAPAKSAPATPIAKPGGDADGPAAAGAGSGASCPAPSSSPTPGLPQAGGAEDGTGKLVNPGHLESSVGLLQEGLGRLDRSDMLGRLDGLVSLGDRGEGATLPFGASGDFVNSRYDPTSGKVEFGDGARVPLKEVLDRTRVRDGELKDPALADLAAVRNGPLAQEGLSAAFAFSLPSAEPLGPPIPGEAENKSPAPLPGPVPTRPVPSRTDTDEEDRRDDLAAFARVRTDPETGGLKGATGYIDPRRFENQIVNRMVHRADPSQLGHDAIHLVTGFGLDPISASRTPGGKGFNTTALELEKGFPPKDVQRNLNGLMTEMTVDGVWDALKTRVDLDAEVAKLPAHLQEPGRDVLQSLADQTGAGAAIPGIEPGTDFARQAEEVKRLGDFYDDPDRPGTRGFVPRKEVTDVFESRFADMLDANPQIKDELVDNLMYYVETAAAVKKAADEGRPPPNLQIELQQNPETTDTLIRTALDALGDVNAAAPTPGVSELMNYYRSVLENGEDGSPQIVRAPTNGPAVA